MLATTNPFPLYADTDGKPLDNGAVYFGLPNQDAQTQPKPVFWDAAGNIPAAQPIKTLNGYTVRAGTPAQVYVDGDYSITVRNRKGGMVVYARTSAEFSNAQVVQTNVDNLTSGLANGTDPTKGAGMVKFGGAVTYPAGTLGFVAHAAALVDAFRQPSDPDDTLSIQRAVNAAANAGAGVVVFTPFRDYTVSAKIGVINRGVHIEGRNATINSTVTSGQVFEIEGSGVRVNDLCVQRVSGTPTAAFTVKGINHIFDNVTSFDTKWPIFFKCTDLRNSHFRNLRVDLDVAGMLGDIFELNYCVNNSVHGVLQYAHRAVQLSTTPHPSLGYHNEGFSLTPGSTTYGCDIAVNGDFVTHLSIIGCTLDVCKTNCVVVTNGESLVLDGNWLGLQAGTASSVAVVVVSNFTAAGLDDNIIMGAGSNVGAKAFSVAGNSCTVNGNYARNVDLGIFVGDGGSESNNLVVGGARWSASSAQKSFLSMGDMVLEHPGMVGPGVSIAQTLYTYNYTGTGYQRAIRGANANQIGFNWGSVALGDGMKLDPDTLDLVLPQHAWNMNRLRLGNNFLWFDATGALRKKASAPTSDLDGTPV
jgi:hypothetical protein